LIRLASHADLVLPFDAMRYRYCSKLVTCLLLATFLVACAGTVFGYDWCFGDDGHVEVSFSNGAGCCAEEIGSHASGRYIVPTISQSYDDSCGSCLDVTSQQHGAVFVKRLKRVSTPPVLTVAANSSFPEMLRDATVIASLTSITPRVSPTLLAHRTVVLLN
jgi:hypothetical protein